MKKLFAPALFAAIAGTFPIFANANTNFPADENHCAVNETPAARDARMRWWRDAKFGMFIHYGLYSGLAGVWRGAPAGGEWIQKNVETDTATYATEAFPRFQPREKIADEWAALAEEAGCRYAVFTSKHHEGFAMFESAQTQFNSAAKFKRDFVREFTEAFRARGMRVGLYHSVIDWHNPNYDNTIQPELAYPRGQVALLKTLDLARDQEKYKKYLREQVREILTNYGKIDVIWWDYSQGKAEGARAWDAPALIEMCREINPQIIMNNRLYAFAGLDTATVSSLDPRCGDFTTPEKHIPREGFPGLDWESCMTVGNHWGFSHSDKNFKSAETVILQLRECAAKGGNLLLNIGPRVDGSVPEEVATAFRGVGKWLKTNGEAIYGTRAFYGAKDASGEILPASRTDEAVYVFVPQGKTPDDLEIFINGVRVAGKTLGETICPVVKIPLNRAETAES